MLYTLYLSIDLHNKRYHFFQPSILNCVPVGASCTALSSFFHSVFPYFKRGATMVDQDPPNVEPGHGSKQKSPTPVKTGPGRRSTKKQEKILDRPRTLFDTDGNISSQNILDPEASPARSTRNARKQLATDDYDDNSNGLLPPIKRQKLYDHRPMRGRGRGRPPKRTKQKLLEQNPATPLDQVRNGVLSDKAKELQTIYEQHANNLRELYHLEVNQNMLDYNPSAFAPGSFLDERFNKFAQPYDLWERAAVYLGRNDLVHMLQDVFAESSTAVASSSAAKKGVQIYTGSEVRRFIRQYPTLNDYLSTFVSIDDNEDITPEEADAVVEKEAGIRERINALNARGGFSTRLQTIANRRPQFERNRNDSVHDAVVAQAVTTSKLFASNSKHRRNAARKCAKAIERHWELIRTHDERLQKNEERRMMRLAKRTAQHVMKKWKVVERVCEARYKEILKEEQAQEGRRHLQKILEHSEQMLGVRMEELTSRKAAAASADESPTPPPVISSSSSVITSRTNEPDAPTPDKVTAAAAPTTSASTVSDEEFSADEAGEDDDHVIFDDEGESEDDDDELRELEADQDLDVEELIKKYNYRLESEDEEEEKEEKEQQENVREEGENESDVEMTEKETPAAGSAYEKVEKDDVNVVELETLESEVEEQEQQQTPEDVMDEDKEAVEVEQQQRHTQEEEEGVDDDDDDQTVTVYGSDMTDVEEEDGERRKRTKNSNQKNSQNVVATASDATTSTAVSQQPTAQPTGTTLSTTKVDTQIPFLLRGTLREYQHVGLDWLASLYINGLNGILADEMGLGKTIQTISLLAYLACEMGIWGPHLIVVPTSVILNWEMEFKRWLPGFKILTYYGTPKERKEKRSGWSKENAFHVCITSYQLVIQDQNVFRRKAWQYLVLDEAHHIKNFRSQRWQVLLNFNSARRLLLTGTPLQNNLMELWSLLYFLMPNGVSESMPIGFASQKEFQEWFSHPVDRMIEGQQGMDADSRAAIQKLHIVLRPYLLRRLKADVEKQLPEKHEHVVYCRLSKRQRYLYDDFMSRAKTKETLASGNFLSIINCLMQLRKVCNHPDLFEERPITTSFAMDDQVQWSGQLLESRIRKRFSVYPPDLNSVNLVISRNEDMSMAVAEAYNRLDAAKSFVRAIAKHQTYIDIAEARGITSSRYQDLRSYGGRYGYHDLKKYQKYRQLEQHCDAVDRWESIMSINKFRCVRRPILGASLIDMCLTATQGYKRVYFPSASHDERSYLDRSDIIRSLVLGYKERVDCNLDIIERYGFVTPGAVIQHSTTAVPELVPSDAPMQVQARLRQALNNDIFHPIQSRLSIAFPDKRLLQYDCGKLQKLDALLRQLAAGGHRALIFTQMTRVLDVLEVFLNMHGHRYLRLDGATKIEQRQVLTEQFNSDKRILAFILSTRSGGLGINLTGADTVIFYDSDWNPSMDKQCQDRTHRIGQTRDVHIYRFVTEYTIEENIFKKANQKRLLDNVVIQEGGFTDDYFQKMDWWRDLPEVTGKETNAVTPTMDIEQALLQAEEDENDARAAITARNEMDMDEREFNETRQSRSPSDSPKPSTSAVVTPAAVSGADDEEGLDEPMAVVEEEEEEAAAAAAAEEEEEGNDEEEMQLAVGHVDQYMLRFWEREMFGRFLGFGGLPDQEELES
ncbi:SNF2 family N-terminal domain-containing protein [Zychaea mexicana]|uniref:SNF2 family N-terminal domain-containing protein n=1 Tax=Zychaea mexicana TaxID=64656 RepID=UPI0022FF4428|nr:SNF2 family N-terminal domain-containing protein [Zychaea mexicana]KAI9499562.1 SNF2 family N-terminal domain-containing protein [Zychaea mexicana]